MYEVMSLFPTLHVQGVAAFTCDPNTWKAEAGESEAQGTVT